MSRGSAACSRPSPARPGRLTGRALRFLLVLVLGAVVALTAGPAEAQAPFPDVDRNASYAHAVDALALFGIVHGEPDGTFRPERPVERQALVVTLVRLVGQGERAPLYDLLHTTFTDDGEIASWARGHVTIARILNIVQGYPDGSFQPHRHVTAAEAYAMMLRTLEIMEPPTSRWPIWPVVVAADTGVSDGARAVAKAPITRGQLAQLLFNTGTSTWGTTEEGLVRPALRTPLLQERDEDLYHRFAP